MPRFRRFVDAAHLRQAVVWCGGPVAALVVAAGCVSAQSGAAPSSAPATVTASPVASPSPIVAASTRLSSGAATTADLPAASIDVSPAQVQVGAVTLSMTLEPARHMLAQSAATSADPDPAHQSLTDSNAPVATAFVLDSLLRLTNNVDPSQPLPDDRPDAMIRHIGVQVRSGDAGYPVPYLSASVDLLLDGHPTTSGVALVPMIAGEAASPQLYYGNNLKLTQRGTYQAFVRLQPSALLGKDAPPTAQFNVVVR